MPIPTPQDTKLKVFQLHLQGHTNQEIASFVGISTGNVSNILAEFKQNVDEGDYQSLMYLGKVCKKNNVNFSKAFECIPLNRILEENNIDQSKFEDFIRVYLNSQKDLPPDQLVDYSLKLFEISEKAEEDIADIPSLYQSLLEKFQKLQSKVASIQTQIKEQENEIRKRLEEKNVTLQVLQEFIETQKELKSFGLEVDDCKTLVQEIRNAKSEGYNWAKITQQISKVKSLDEQIIEKENKVIKIERDIKNYKEVIELCKKDYSSTKDKLDKLKEEHKEEKGAVNAIKRLQRSGVTVSSIELWNNIRICWKDPVEFDEHLKDTKKRLDFIDNLQEKINTQKSENSKLRGQKNALQLEIKSKTSTLDTLDIKILKSLEKPFAQIKKHTNYVTQHTTQKLDYHDDKVQRHLKNTLDSFSQKVDSSLQGFDDKMSGIFESIKEAAKFDLIEPFYRLMTRATGEKQTVYLSVVQLLQSLEVWMQKNNERVLLRAHVNDLRRELEEQLEKSTVRLF